MTFAILLVACTGDDDETVPVDPVPDAALEPMAPLPPTTTAPTTTAAAVAAPVALLGEHGHLGPIRDGQVENTWVKWTARPSPDGSVAVLTIQPETARTISSTPLSWAALPSGDETHELKIPGQALEVTAVSDAGKFVALTNFADEPVGGQIAGAKETTNLVIATRDGVQYQASIDGNFEAEAFGRTMAGNGLPAQVFLLEYFPADSPTHYRVRVLSTETGEISLPLDLRDKTQTVDERMAGISRSQVIANEHGLLFTLYRATDDMPDGHPYAFVHTLDLADGVWCLDVDPSLELEHLPGTLAVGGDRLYVASANGRVGSFAIPSISDPSRSPTMDWVVDVARPGDRPPVLVADDDGVWVGTPDDVSRLVRLSPEGERGDPMGLPSGHPLALAATADEILAIGDDWSTFGKIEIPDWF
ncbi:MAG: hypothetical protein ACLGHQ_05345, partial [Acidimicrobiia bacterium]